MRECEDGIHDNATSTPLLSNKIEKSVNFNKSETKSEHFQTEPEVYFEQSCQTYNLEIVDSSAEAQKQQLKAL